MVDVPASDTAPSSARSSIFTVDHKADGRTLVFRTVNGTKPSELKMASSRPDLVAWLLAAGIRSMSLNTDSTIPTWPRLLTAKPASAA